MFLKKFDCSFMGIFVNFLVIRPMRAALSVPSMISIWINVDLKRCSTVFNKFPRLFNFMQFLSNVFCTMKSEYRRA